VGEEVKEEDTVPLAVRLLRELQVTLRVVFTVGELLCVEERLGDWVTLGEGLWDLLMVSVLLAWALLEAVRVEVPPGPEV
jgi:hypothetical protein